MKVSVDSCWMLFDQEKTINLIKRKHHRLNHRNVLVFPIERQNILRRLFHSFLRTTFHDLQYERFHLIQFSSILCGFRVAFIRMQSDIDSLLSFSLNEIAHLLIELESFFPCTQKYRISSGFSWSNWLNIYAFNDITCNFISTFNAVQLNCSKSFSELSLLKCSLFRFVCVYSIHIHRWYREHTLYLVSHCTECGRKPTV